MTAREPSRREQLAALDERLLPAPSAAVARLVAGWARLRGSRWGRSAAVALTRTGLLGPAVLVVLFTGCLMGATGLR